MPDGTQEIPLRLRKARGILLTMEQVSRNIYPHAHTKEALQQVHWAALRYMRRAGQPARNVVGLAKFLGVTSGPASRTAKVLVKRGLITARQSPDDSRAKVFDLTPEGVRCLEDDPASIAAKYLDSISEEDLDTLSLALDRLTSLLLKKTDQGTD